MSLTPAVTSHLRPARESQSSASNPTDVTACMDPSNPLRNALRRNSGKGAVRGFCYPWITMSALNGDKARFHRTRKNKLARREHIRALRKKLAAPAPRRPNGGDL